MYTIFLLLTALAGTVLGAPCTNDKTTSDYYYYIPEAGSTGELTLKKEECPSGYYYYIPEAGNSGDIEVIKE
ncbi:MAG: hypothetical protein K2G45_04905 [Lachnospiraceae bacterium]|nr:hypothetical protein [Lachnospiraceae bacterium]